MAFKFTPYKYGGLAAGFCLGSVPLLTAALTAPASSSLGIFLSGLLVMLGATGYGFGLFACIIAGGLLGVALVLLISYIIKSFKNRSKNLIQTHRFLKGNSMDEKYQLNIQQNPTEEKSIELMQQPPLATDKSNIHDIDNLLKWGEKIRKSVYEQVVNQKNVEIIKESLKENSQILVEKYKELALRYHPDKEPNLSQKTEKEEIFKTLQNAYGTVKKCWELALEGVDQSIFPRVGKSYPAEDITNTLLAEQNELLRMQIQLRKEYMENLKKAYDEVAAEMDVFIENEVNEMEKRIEHRLKNRFPHLCSNNDSNNKEPQQNSWSFLSYMGTFFSNISHSFSQTGNQTCISSQEAQEEKEQLSPLPSQSSFSCKPCNRHEESES